MNYIRYLKIPFYKKEYCPFCGKVTPMKKGGYPFPRKNAQCIYCNSLERHRFLYYVYQIVFFNERKHLKILHFDPEKAIWEILSKRGNTEYICGDIRPKDYPFVQNCLKIDATKTQFPDKSFDIILANHLIEHIDEAVFLTEMKRILRDDGKLLISTPLYDELPETIEDDRINTRELRQKYYGHPEHLRKYGNDICKRFEKYFDVNFIGNEKLKPFGDRVNSNCFILTQKKI